MGHGTPATPIESDPEKAVLRALLERYLGGTDSSLARRLLAPERDEVTVRIDPDRLHSWDFTERMRDVWGGRLTGAVAPSCRASWKKSEVASSSPRSDEET
ncbi:MAG: hypothetical protein ABEJ82_06740 [Haloplanus sp.]